MSPTLTLEGMNCWHCEQPVEAAVATISGVRDTEADQVTDDGDADPEELVAAVEAAANQVAA